MTLRLQIVAVAICLLASLTVVRSAESLPDIRQQQERVRDDLAAGELVLEASKRQVVDKEQRVVFALIDGKSSLGELSPAQRVSLRNALETINAALSGTAGAEEDREVCWQEKRTGSKLVTTVCGTVRERQQAKEGARDYLQRPRLCAPPGCGASP